MTQFLPSNLLALFAARDPIVFLPPAGKLSHEKVRSGFTGVGEFLDGFEDPKDTPPKTKVENREERMERKRRDKAERMAYKLEQQIATWNPQESASTTDPHKTLFVGRVNYDTSESKLRREFESYGPVKKIVMVFNQKTGKPRGYAFVEYEHERDMQGAFKNADGKKIDGRRIVVDVERGRTVKGWLPRRLGGGLGGTRRGGPEVNVKISGRDPDMDRPGDGDRGRRVGRSRENSRSRVRSRSRSNSRRDKTRDRDRSLRDRHRVERGRSRDRDRKDKDKDKDKEKEHKKRKRSKSRSPLPRRDSAAEEGEIKGAKKRRAHEKEKKRHRSKSRDRDKDKKKDRKDRDKDKKRSKEDRVRVKDEPNEYDVHVKEEPVDDEYPNNYDPYEEYGVYVKTEPGVEGEANHDENYDDYNNAFV